MDVRAVTSASSARVTRALEVALAAAKGGPLPAADAGSHGV